MLIPLVTLPSPLPEDAEWVANAARLAIAGPLCVILPTEHVTVAEVEFLKPLLRMAPAALGMFTVAPHHIEFATQLLDNGALTVAFRLALDASDSAASSAIGDLAEAISTLPRSRVEIGIEPTESAGLEAAAAAMVALRALSCGFIITVDNLSLSSNEIRQLQQAASGNRIALCLRPGSTAGLSAAEVGRLHKNDVSVIQPACIAKNSEEHELYAAGGQLDTGSCLAQCVRSDRPDGLFTTIVSDEFGKALGLVYSSQESILEAIRCGRGVYYSRSRGGLWRKGDTSGCWQALRSIRLDCDSDALIFSVKQMGSVPAFCHLNTRTCWGEDGGLTALEFLQRTLAARLVDAPAGSYTKRLFDDPTLLKHKLLEEAQELSEATDPDHVAAEAADVIYFAMVACAKAGVSLADVEAHLDRRALKIRRRTGDSKPARIAAAQAHFEAVNAAKFALTS